MLPLIYLSLLLHVSSYIFGKWEPDYDPVINKEPQKRQIQAYKRPQCVPIGPSTFLDGHAHVPDSLHGEKDQDAQPHN